MDDDFPYPYHSELYDQIYEKRTRMYLIHEEKAEYHPLTKLIAIIPAGLLIGAVVLLFNHEIEAFWILGIEAVLITLLFYYIFPRKFQIYQDAVKIVLGNPFSIAIPLSTIKEARHAGKGSALVYSGIRFATSPRYVIEIVRNKGMNYVITPQNGEVFLEQLNQAIKGRSV
jgi:hypothetical protein